MIDMKDETPDCSGQSLADSEAEIRKRTPDEQAAAEATDRRVKYDAKLAKMGIERFTIQTRWEAKEAFRSLSRLLKGPHGDEHVAALLEFVAERERMQ
ncbi:hypothetical protein [Novosphingobium naphthalenivorans]|uniref:hypothetical protein n=1 Tax=Novosphingobium naphthalenivorans TaxID=273168 RepID=UPI0008294EB0|nr:hypothetical protein [Novosphingobium naphthalenivorans]